MGGCEGLVTLRRAKEADARAIAEVHVATWRRAYAGLMPAELLDALDVNRRAAFWARVIATSPAVRRPWVALAEGNVVGFVSAGESHEDSAPTTIGEIYAIYVAAECWDRGVGRNLLGHAERDLRENRYHVATLWVLASNERARRFYEAAGWQPDGRERTESFGEADLLEVRYRKAL